MEAEKEKLGFQAHMDVGVGCSLHKGATQGAGGAAARPALGFSGCGPWRGRHSTHAVVPFPNPVKGATGERCGLRAPEAAVREPGALHGLFVKLHFH